MHEYELYVSIIQPFQMLFIFFIVFTLNISFASADSSNPQCSKLVGFYDGNFVRSKEHLQATFQTTIIANNTDSTVTISLDDLTTNGTDVFLHVTNTGDYCRVGTPCIATFNHFSTPLLLHIHNDNDIFEIMYVFFDTTTGLFTLNVPDEQCSNDELTVHDSFFPDTTQFKYCVCCDFYQQPTGMQCPNDLWQTTTSTSTSTSTSTTVLTSTSTPTSTSTSTITSTSTANPTTTSTLAPSGDPFGIDCNHPTTKLDVIYCNKTWSTPAEISSIVNQTIDALQVSNASKADAYQVSDIFHRIGNIQDVLLNDFDKIYELYDKILNINENTLWAANDENAGTTYKLLNGLHSLMSLTNYTLNLTQGRNVGITRTNQTNCNPHEYVGFADYGNSFGPNNQGGYLASIEIPLSALCSQNEDPNPVYYAIYRNVNIFVPNSTDEESKQHHLVSQFAVNEKESGKKFDPEKEPVKPQRCAIGFHQNRNRVLSATVIDKTEYKESSKTMAILRYRKKDVRESLHGKFLVTWWNGDQWSSDRTCAVRSEGDFYVAECNHLTDFTLLVDGAQTDPLLCDTALSVVGFVTNGGSIFSLLLLNAANALNFFTPLRDLVFGMFIALPYSRFQVDALTFTYSIALMLFYFFFTIFNDQTRTGGNIACQIFAAIDYWLLLCCISLTLFQSWRILKVFAWTSWMEKVIGIITKPIVIIVASLAVLVAHDFYNRKDDFCWIKPTYVVLGVVVPITLLIVNGVISFSIILMRMYPNARVFQPLRRLTSVQSSVISKGQRNNAKDKIIAVLIMQFSLGLPWAVQYLALFAPRATAGHYIFTIIIGSQGIILFLLFVYKRYKAYKRQQQVSSSGAETAFTSTNQPPHSPRGLPRTYDSAYEPQIPSHRESTVQRARQFVLNKIPSRKQKRRDSVPAAPPIETLPGHRRRND
ncbi:hypothetical protein M3Y95_01117400 [Aphelenchoides besseyi]|nr:hypothetical protein M3Y95_01117400 [Aphelenchoides besseyi]